jgi:hypothetical protein
MVSKGDVWHEESWFLTANKVSSPSFHSEGLGLSPGHFMWNYWLTKWYWERFFFENWLFPVSIIPSVLYTHQFIDLFTHYRYLIISAEDIIVKYKMVQIWPGLFVCKQVTVCSGHIWTTLYKNLTKKFRIVQTGFAAHTHLHTAPRHGDRQLYCHLRNRQ